MLPVEKARFEFMDALTEQTKEYGFILGVGESTGTLDAKDEDGNTWFLDIGWEGDHYDAIYF